MKNEPVYVLLKHEVMQKFDNGVYVYGVYDNLEECYKHFKIIIDNYKNDYDMWDSSFTEGDMAVELHFRDNTEDFEDYTNIWIEEKTLLTRREK